MSPGEVNVTCQLCLHFLAKLPNLRKLEGIAFLNEILLVA